MLTCAKLHTVAHASVDVMDETFVVAAPARVAAAFADPRRWPVLWPDLDLRVIADRGDLGVRWRVVGEWAGSMEVWLEAVGDGTVLHYFLHLVRSDPTAALSVRAAAREAARRHRAAKALAFALKDRLEEGREPGTAARRPEPRA